MNMVRVRYKNYNAKIGAVHFTNNGHLAYFAGYHTCECGAINKVLISSDELRELRGDVDAKRRNQFGKKLARRIASYYRLTASDLSLE